MSNDNSVIIRREFQNEHFLGIAPDRHERIATVEMIGLYCFLLTPHRDQKD